MRVSLTTVCVGVISLIGVAIVYSALARAEAQTTCTRVGNTTYCSNTSGQTRTCTQVGNTTYCN